VSAIVFDCDGVLADTERFGHLPAFNRMFEELGVPLHWSEEEYGRKLQIAGGKERMASELTPEFVERAGLPSDTDGQAAMLATWHQRKTQIYTDMVASGALPTRPGIARIIGEAQDAGWKVAVASTSAEPSVRAIWEQAAGPDRASRIDALLAGDCVAHKKPAPDIYLLALETLALDRREAVVIEDSRNGLEAAHRARLRCVVTVSSYTQQEDFTEAAMVVSSLGDPEGEHTVVLANSSQARPKDDVVLEDLRAVLAG
jgi:HAD superfamily hydrolase (TIGR01509 family)